MKKFLVGLCMLFVAIAMAHAITVDWIVDGETYTQTTCDIGDDLILPATPTKYGYTFQGWVEYTKIEYIESTGTQYIDTGIRQNTSLSSIKQYIGISFSQSYSGRQLSGFDGSRNNYFGTTAVNGNMFFDIGQRGAYPIALNTKYDLYMLQVPTYASLNVYLDGNTVESITTTSYAGFNNSLLCIFKMSGNYTPLRYARIYYYRVLVNDVLVRDFIPVLDADGVACLYDKVSDEFFYNAGTGNFTAGPAI